MSVFEGHDVESRHRSAPTQPPFPAPSDTGWEAGVRSQNLLARDRLSGAPRMSRSARRSARVLSPRSAAARWRQELSLRHPGCVGFIDAAAAYRFGCLLRAGPRAATRELRDWALLHRSSPRVLLSKTASWPCPGRLCGLQNTLCRLGCELAACKTLGSPKPEADPPGCPFEE